MIGVDVWLAYLLLGVVVGFFAGLLGIGGGGIMVPVLTALFLWQGFPVELVVHLALGTSMAAIVPTSVASLVTHHRKGAVLWPMVQHLSPGVIIGTFAATFLAVRVSAEGLAIFFFCFMSCIAVQMWLDIRPKPTRQLPGVMGLTGVGLGIGGFSALVAIGGGSLTVPFLIRCNVNIKQAIASSAAVGLPLSLAGALGYALNGLGQESSVPDSLGYIYWPAALAVVVTSVITAPLGARLAHRLPVGILKKIFAVLLVSLGLKMLSGVF